MAESARLLNGYTPKGYRGFESHPLRHFHERLGGPEALRLRWDVPTLRGDENPFGEPSGEQAMPQASGGSPERSGANPILSATFSRRGLNCGLSLICPFFQASLVSRASFRSWDST